MGKLVDITGQKFGRLTVLKFHGTINKRAYFECLCECGTNKIILGYYLRSGDTKSCGCYNKDISKTKIRKMIELNTLPFGEGAFNMIFSAYKLSAHRRKLEFELTKDFFRKLVSQNCYYCGVEPNQIKKSQHNCGDFIYNGIDRINNNLGYLVENCVTCCGKCNRAKDVMTQQEFFEWVSLIYKNKAA